MVDNFKDAKTLRDDPRYLFNHYIREDVSPTLRYEGWAWSSDDITEECWRIIRTITIGTTTYEDLALDGQFKCRWVTRSGYFAAVPIVYPPVYDAIAPIGTTYTDYINVVGLWGYSILAKWVGAPAVDGSTISIQVSVDGITFEDLPDSEISVTGTDDFMWNVCDVFYNSVRMKILCTGATSVTIIISNRIGASYGE